jgi:hypothetical protein
MKQKLKLILLVPTLVCASVFAFVLAYWTWSDFATQCKSTVIFPENFPKTLPETLPVTLPKTTTEQSLAQPLHAEVSLQKNSSLKNPTPRQPAHQNSVEGLTQWLAPYQSASGLQIRLGVNDQITLVSGLKYPSNWTTGADGLSFAQNFASQLGIPKEQIAQSPSGPPATDVTEVFKYSQVLDDYPVFSSFLQVTQSKAAKEVYLVVNELKNLGTPDLTHNYSSSEIENILRQKYGPDVRISPEENHMQIFSSGNGQAELARAYSLSLLHPARDRRFVLVSTRDGKILFDQSLRTH